MVDLLDEWALIGWGVHACMYIHTFFCLPFNRDYPVKNCQIHHLQFQQATSVSLKTPSDWLLTGNSSASSLSDRVVTKWQRWRDSSPSTASWPWSGFWTLTFDLEMLWHSHWLLRALWGSPASKCHLQYYGFAFWGFTALTFDVCFSVMGTSSWPLGLW